MTPKTKCIRHLGKVVHCGTYFYLGDVIFTTWWHLYITKWGHYHFGYSRITYVVCYYNWKMHGTEEMARPDAYMYYIMRISKQKFITFFKKVFM